MQLLAVVLYHRDGERVHELKFQPGAMNVVTGVSDTGKTAVMEIVDYCLGARDHHVFRGEELDVIGWYGLCLEINGNPIFVARERPAPGIQTSTNAMLVTGTAGAVPAGHVQGTTNIATVTRQMGELIGIHDNAQRPPEGSTREPVTATLRHAVPYVFQPQRLIADPRYLFAGQDDNFKKLHIRDTLPFFLGAVDEDVLKKRRELRKASTDLRDVRRRLVDAEGVSTATTSRVVALLSDARQHGLVATDTEIEPEMARLALAAAIETPLDEAPGTLTGEAAAIANQQDRKSELANTLRELRAERKTLADRRRLARDFSSEAHEQHARLMSLHLLPSDDAAAWTCPLCGAPPDGGAETTENDLIVELRRARAQAEASATAEPELERAIDALDTQIEAMRGRLDELDRELSALIARSELARRTRGRLQQQAYVRGRIAGFLEDHPAMDADQLTQLRELVRLAEERVDALEEEIGPDATRAHTENALGYVGEDMTQMAKALDLKYAGDGVRLDPVDLTVIGRAPSGPVRLDRDIGSGKNWVGYHVVTLLALHRYFIAHERPVPRFLMLDQPTQAFFPSEKRDQKDRTLSDLPEEARHQVHNIFKVLQEAVTAQDGALQIIVMDHAEIDEAWFATAVGENNWRDGLGLVPRDWYSTA
jgi:Protein of unknown function (DUF3732)